MVMVVSHDYFQIVVNFCHVDGYGLWTISRGLARHRKKYFLNLEVADEPRQGDLDGRGNLSEKGLLEFSIFSYVVPLIKLTLCHQF